MYPKKNEYTLFYRATVKARNTEKLGKSKDICSEVCNHFHIRKQSDSSGLCSLANGWLRRDVAEVKSCHGEGSLAPTFY